MKKAAYCGGPTYARTRRIARIIPGLPLMIILLIIPTIAMAQVITFKGNGVSIEKAFAAVTKQTGYSVLYSRAGLGKSKPVTIDANKMPLAQFLGIVFKDQPVKYAIESRTIIVTPNTATPPAGNHPAPDANDASTPSSEIIRGTVRDLDGAAIPGASILIKGTKTGTAAMADGSFAINAKAGDVLVISSLGFTPLEYTVTAATLAANNSPLLLRLKKATNTLDETIVQAYGTTSKRLATGSISVVKSEDLEKQPVSNVMAALEGLVPGLQISQQSGLPGGNFAVQLRGQNSLSQGSNPLYVVDGVPFTSNTLSRVSYYTPLGDNGVSPLDGINMADIESITVLKDASATSIYGARGANGVILITMKKGRRGASQVNVNAYSGWGKDVQRINLLNTPQYLALRHEAFKNNNATPNAGSAPDLVLWDTTKNTNWQKELLGGTAHYDDLQASVSGGNGNTGFLLGGGYHKEGTVFPGNANNTKGAVHFNANHNSTDGKLRALITGSFTHNNLNLPLQDLTQQVFLAPDRPDLVNKDGSLNWADGNNPLSYLQQPYKSITDNLVANASIGYNIIQDLQLKADLGYTDLRSNETQVTPLSSINPAYLAFSSSSANFGSSEYRVWNVEPQLNYHHRWGKNALSVLVGSTIQSSNNKGQLIAATGFLSDALLTDIQAAKTLTVSNNTNAITKDNSLFSRISFNRDEKYLLDLSARRDGSSRFGPGKQFGNFGAVGVGWVFTREAFLENAIPFLNFGKLRASYGSVGNTPGGDYNYLSLWNVASYPYNGQSNLYPANLYNPDYAWEVTRKLELATDLELLKSRVKISVDYYRNRSSNQLVTYNLPTITGFTGVVANLPATVQNTGWEVSLQTVNINSAKLRWTSNFSFSAPRNKLVSFPGLATSSYADQYIIGKPIYIQRKFHYDDVDPKTGVYRFETADGPSSSPDYSVDRYTAFDPKPKYWGGLENTFSYKGLSLSFLFTYAKQKGLNLDPGVIPGFLGNLPDSYVGRWQQAGDISNRQQVTTGFNLIFPYFNLQSSDYFVHDASFIRLKNLSLSYQLPSGLLSKAHITGTRIYMQAQNLFTITNFPGLDPETQSINVLPPLRVITFGLQLTL